MYWKLILSQTSGALELWDKDLVTQKIWPENRNTSQDILLAMESIRKEQGLAWSEVPKFELDLDLSPHATARRIAETFQKIYTTLAV